MDNARYQQFDEQNLPPASGRDASQLEVLKNMSTHLHVNQQTSWEPAFAARCCGRAAAHQGAKVDAVHGSVETLKDVRTRLPYLDFWRRATFIARCALS
mmetsp:Transcript_155788/g.275233  ORF Transcript_155788/g.275233 Transcript_155788/m.275233 type:complete len:99 (-) Transcript_155788:1087-1383(-)